MLGLDVQVDNDRLRFYAGTALLLDSADRIARLQEMCDAAQRRAEEADQLRKEETRRRKEGEQRSEEETRRRKEGEQRSEEVDRRREEAEQEIARLRKELERLQR